MNSDELRKIVDDAFYEDSRYRMAGHQLDAVIKAVAAACSAPRVEWIPVTERLPERTGDVLIHTSTAGNPSWVGLGCFYKKGDYIEADRFIAWCGDLPASDCNDGEVTHWMPLPPQPEGGA